LYIEAKELDTLVLLVPLSVQMLLQCYIICASKKHNNSNTPIGASLEDSGFRGEIFVLIKKMQGSS